MVRNAAVKFNWESGFPYPLSPAIPAESILRDYGFIMRKGKRGYVPVNLESGDQLTLPAEPLVVDQALQEINNLSKNYGMDFSSKKRFQQTAGDLINGSPAFLGIVAMELLDLYGIDIRLNKATGQWERAE